MARKPYRRYTPWPLVTIALSSASVDYFKMEAAKHDVQYQKLIRHVLDVYVAQHKQG